MGTRKIVGMFLLLMSGMLFAQGDEISVQSTEVAPGLFMLDGVDGQFVGGNMSVLIGDDGVFLIDDGIATTGPALLAAIAELTDQPVDFLINTHIHGDHVGSNVAIRAHGATIVAHDNIRKRLLVATGDEAMPPEGLPQITFSDSTTFHLNGHSAHVIHVARAHTDGDAIIHFPDINVIHAGDVFFNRLFPFVDHDAGGSVAGFLAAQDKIYAMADDDTIIIAGHGSLGNKADVKLARDVLADCHARVRKLLDAGMSEDEIVAANPLADYHDVWNWGFITTERMTRSMVRSLTD
jgi:glyoxylase-like metal-dependent hydrolase (beta-lactamase superfamily II)